MTRLRYDIVALGDFRFPGGTAACIAEQVRAQTAAGYRTAMVQVKGPVLKSPHPLNPLIQACLDEGLADLLHPDAAAEARLLLAYHPELFTHPWIQPPDVTAEHRLLVVNHPPFDGAGRPFYDRAAVHAHARRALGGDVIWAPVGPRVREQLLAIHDGPALTDEDWLEIIDADAWAVPREAWRSDRPVIGRHSRPHWLKWPADKETLFAAYPDDPGFRVRILGGGEALEAVAEVYPPSWEVLPFGAQAPRDFLAAIDFFVYYHHPQWVEAFGRVVLEAMANGALAVLPPSFQDLFGDAAVYAEPGDVASTVRELYADREAYLAKTRRASVVVRERFGPQAHVARIEARIGPPRGDFLPAATAPRPRPRRVLFMTSNGVGMGHLTRMLAVARRCGPAIRPVFMTMSQAAGILKDWGYQAEYLPFHGYLKCDQAIWNHHLRRELNEIIAFYEAAALVFDGNLAYKGLVRALRDNPQCPGLWFRRGMWRPGAATEAGIDREADFHAVIEPGEIAGADDSGLTVRHRDRTRLVAPIRLLDDDEALPRQAARHELGLASEGLAVLVQLGAENNVDFAEIRTRILDRLLERGGIQVAVAQWMMSKRPLDLPEGVHTLQTFPLGKFFNAFDFVVSAAGYNSFHELIAAGIPTLFVPNENPVMDEQVTRANHARRHGLGPCLRAHETRRVDECVMELLDDKRRQAITAQCRTLKSANGAAEAARFVESLALGLRADLPPGELRPTRPS